VCARGAQSGAATDAPRDAKGRFAKGHSGNPKGRPHGIRNPRRWPLGLLLRQARPGTLAPLVRRKRYLRLPVLRLVLPPAREPDPGERLGIDFSRMRSAAEIAAAMSNLFAAIGRGEIAPSEGLRLARRARKPLRGTRRELWRDLARLEATRRGARSGGEFPVLREFRPRPRLNRRAEARRKPQRLAAPRCFRQPESSHIKGFVLIFFRLARARAKGPAGRRGRRFASPGAPIIVG